MCIFCGAIPATMALGVSVRANQNQQRRIAQAKGGQVQKPRIPAGPVTAIVVAALVTGSVVVHTHLAG